MTANGADAVRLRTDPLSFRTVALIPVVLFIPSIVSFVVDPGATWAEYPGVFFHLAILVVVARLDAPVWATAAGFLWLGLDVLSAILTINGVPETLAWPVRLGGHVLAGTWILVSSLGIRSWPVRIVGAVTGLWLGGYSFVGNVLPHVALYPASLLIVVWFILLAIIVGSRFR